MNRIKKYILKHIVSVTIIAIFLIYSLIVIAIWIIRKNDLASWNAISALGEWAGILIAVLIPIAAVYLEKQLEKNKTEIKNSNISLYDEILNLKSELKEIKISGNQNNNVIDLKKEIYKFICISMVTTTKEIMEKFNIDFEKAKDILLELSRVEGIIRPAYISDNPEDINCNWSKRS